MGNQISYIIKKAEDKIHLVSAFCFITFFLLKYQKAMDKTLSSIAF